MKKIILSMTLVSLLLANSFVSIFATQEYPNKKGSIIINAISEQTAITGIEYNLYKIADIDNDNFEFNVIDNYKTIVKKIDYSNSNNENDWSNWLEKFSSRITANNIEADYTGVTTDGVLEFNDLPVGLYLVSGKKTKINIEGINYYITPQKTFVAIPNLVEGQYVYNIEVNNKLDKTIAPFIDIDVVKVFKDSGYENRRPNSIEIELYKDNVLEGTYELNQDNNFSYSFLNLDNDFEWDIKEKEVNGYTATYDVDTIDDYDNDINHRKKYITITNTYVVPNPPTDNPPTDNPPGENPPGDKPALPSTGVLWWPVPVLGTLGLMLVTIGKYQERKNEK